MSNFVVYVMHTHIYNMLVFIVAVTLGQYSRVATGHEPTSPRGLAAIKKDVMTTPPAEG